MIELEERVRRDLRELAAEATAAPDLQDRMFDRIARRRHRALAQRAGATVVSAGLAIAVVATALTGGSGPRVTDIASATPRTGDPGWATIAEPLIEARVQHASVAVDGEVLVFGGYDAENHEAHGAAMYDPEAGRWRVVADPPGDMHAPVAVWTGAVVLVTDNDGRLFSYDPATDVWAERAHTPFDTGSNGVTKLAWTGSKLLMAQPRDPEHVHPPLATYDPEADAWTWDDEPMPVDSPFAFEWTGDGLLVAGHTETSKSLLQTDLWSYTDADGWRRLPAPPLQLWASRWAGYAIWTGTELVVGGGRGQTEEGAAFWASVTGTAQELTADEWQLVRPVPVLDLAAWNPATRTWRELPDAPVASSGRNFRYGDVWTGREVVTWVTEDTNAGMFGLDGRLALLDPATGAWRLVDPPAVGNQQEAPAVWTGHELVIVSGEPTTGDADGSRCCLPANVATAFTP